MPPLNYQPLSTAEDIDVDGRQVDLSGPQLSIFTSLRTRDQILIAVLIILAIVAAIPTQGIGAILVLIIPVIIYSRRLERQKNQAWSAFAAANGFSLVPSKQAMGLVPPAVLNNGHDHKNSDAVSGTIFGTPSWIFRHEFTIGYGKGSTTYTVTIMEMEIKTNMPHIFIRSPKAMASGNTGLLKQKLNLEGDFNKYFKVFTEKDDEVDELQILSPDMMQFLMQNSQYYNIETSADKLYIIADRDLRRADKLPQFIEAAHPSSAGFADGPSRRCGRDHPGSGDCDSMIQI